MRHVVDKKYMLVYFPIMLYYSKLPDPSGLKPEDLTSADKVLAALQKEAIPGDSAIQEALELVRKRLKYRMTPAGEGSARYQEHQNFLDGLESDALEQHLGWLLGELVTLARRPNSFDEVNVLLTTFIQEHRGLKRQMPSVGPDVLEFKAHDDSWVVRLNRKAREMDVERKTQV